MRRAMSRVVVFVQIAAMLSTFFSPIKRSHSLFHRWLYPEGHAIVNKASLMKYLPKDLAARTINTKAVVGNANTDTQRFVKSHLPLSMNNPRLLDTCKVVYVARNPKDVCVSFYNHCKLMATYGYSGDLEVSWPTQGLFTVVCVLN